MTYLDDAMKQSQQIEAMLNKSARELVVRRDAADRIQHTLKSEMIFNELQNPQADLIFNVPEGNDYEVARLVLYPEVRVVPVNPETQGTADVVFRPAAWFSEITAVDPNSKARRYQNVGFFASQTFSGVFSSGGFGNPLWGCPYTFNAYPSGLVFDPLYRLRSGSTLTVKVTVTYSGPRQPAGEEELGDGRINQYRIRGCLEGYKRVPR